MFKGRVLKIEGTNHHVKLEDGEEVPSVQNTSGMKIDIGDYVAIDYMNNNLDNPIIASVYDKIGVDLYYPVGSPFLTFLKNEDPNIRFSGTEWQLLAENTYLVSAGSSIKSGQNVGSNSIRIDWQHTHGTTKTTTPMSGTSSITLTAQAESSHTHPRPNEIPTGNADVDATLSQSSCINPASSSNTYARGGTTTCGFATVKNTGVGTAHTHTIQNHDHNYTTPTVGTVINTQDNRPNSIGVYIWIRLK